MVQAVHGKNFSKRKWANFLSKRAVPGSKVAFQEIEVLLCNVKSSLDVLKDREDEERERLGKIVNTLFLVSLNQSCSSKCCLNIIYACHVLDYKSLVKVLRVKAM